MSVYTLARPDDAEDLALATTVFGDVRTVLKSAYVVDVVVSPLDGETRMWIAAGDTRYGLIFHGGDYEAETNCAAQII